MIFHLFIPSQVKSFLKIDKRDIIIQWEILIDECFKAIAFAQDPQLLDNYDRSWRRLIGRQAYI